MCSLVIKPKYSPNRGRMSSNTGQTSVRTLFKDPAKANVLARLYVPQNAPVRIWPFGAAIIFKSFYRFNRSRWQTLALVCT